jgi:enamine deaminase RidA (YjgF/YER057c/UK114 family)
MPTDALSMRARATSGVLLGALCACLPLTFLHVPAADAAPEFRPFVEEGRPYSTGTLSKAGGPIYFTSGATAGAENTGDMKAQANATLDSLTKNVETAGLTLEDVAFVRAYLAPGVDGKIDYAGWQTAWTDKFGKAAVKPARTTVGVPLLGRPGTLIEIEFVAFPAAKSGLFASSDKLGLPVSSKVLKPYGTREGRIYSGMGVLPGSAMYWTQGSTAPVLDAKLPPTDRGHRGDMKTQARNTLLALQKNLENVGLSFADVVYLRAFLGPDVHLDGKFDYDGWNAAYGEFFNNATNPHKPARTTVTTPTYGNPSTLIEIEIIAAFPGKPSMFEANAGPKLKAYGEASAMISSGIAVAEKPSLYFSAGAVSAVEGDVKTQALSALETLKKRMEQAGVSFKDVVFLRAFVVPEADGKVDREGWTAAYTQYFNNPAQPHKPARTTIAVHSLPQPQYKIEIDVVAVASK